MLVLIGWSILVKTFEMAGNEVKREKMVPFDFEEKDCDLIIMTKDAEVHLPSSFWQRASNRKVFNGNVNGVININVGSDKVLFALSYFHPKDWTNSIQRKSFLCLLTDSAS